jgi:hypothetical protein
MTTLPAFRNVRVPIAHAELSTRDGNGFRRGGSEPGIGSRDPERLSQ